MKLWFAPMDGITNCATRLLTQEIFQKYKNPDDSLQIWTEFMNADGFIINPRKVIKHIQTTKEQQAIAQIYGGNPETLFQATQRIAEDHADYFSGIELNTGCPSNTVMKCGGGSDMLKHRETTTTIIQKLSDLVHKNPALTFSVKTRAGLNEEDKEQQKKRIEEISKYCDFITIHGRTLKQLYSGAADWELIKQVQATAACPIIANGGVLSYQDAQELDKARGFAGIMIGQGAIGNPWIFTPHLPSLSEKIQTIEEHLRLMIACDLLFDELVTHATQEPFLQPSYEQIQQKKQEINEQQEYRAIIEFRKYLFQYIKGIPNSRERKQQAIMAKNLQEIKKMLQDLYTNNS